ncbi:MAG: hypothetical protein ACR2G5_16110 [Pyrinomonadaceae bacterium]
MRTLKSLFATTILGVVLSMPAFAGNISTPGVVDPPPPPPPPATQLAGNISTPSLTSNPDNTGELGFADILLALLSLF